ncbi:hypothetical protein MRX96_046238 [Rhipicephalus microplus]
MLLKQTTAIASASIFAKPSYILPLKQTYDIKASVNPVKQRHHYHPDGDGLSNAATTNVTINAAASTTPTASALRGRLTNDKAGSALTVLGEHSDQQ